MKVFFKIFTRIHIALFRLTKGIIGSKMRGMPILLLTTRGRKTERIWTTPLMYMEDSGTYIITASNNGMDRHPAWYLNLRANPDVDVEIKGGKYQATASEIQDAEYHPFWDRLVRQAPFFDGYKGKRSLAIPMIRLVPQE